jgi:copper chaperone NosL
MMRSILLLAGLTMTLVLAACGDDVKASDPPELKLGESTCARCGMIISDERFASGMTFEDQDALLYDDLGEMIVIIQSEDPHPDYTWVHDYDSREWIDATMAWYVASDAIMAPMGSGVVAFAQQESAEAFAAANEGMVLDWQTMLSEWKMPMKMR